MVTVLIDKFALGEIAEEFGIRIQVDPPIDDGVRPDDTRKAWVDLLVPGSRGKIRMEAYVKLSDATLPPAFLHSETEGGYDD